MAFNARAQARYIQSDYNVDLVICIDATGSMDPILDEVKRTAMSFYHLFQEGMEASGKNVTQLRVKVIAFRDYEIDAQPMVQSRFFVLPEEEVQLQAFVDGIEASGGGDEPECALEALATALNSDWVTTGAKRRHAVLLFTDASAHPLAERAGCPGYPRDLPRTLPDLGAWWSGTTQKFYSKFQPKNGRLVAFVPHKEPWISLQTWNNYWPSFTENCGLEGLNIQEAINLLVSSVQ